MPLRKKVIESISGKVEIGNQQQKGENAGNQHPYFLAFKKN